MRYQIPIIIATLSLTSLLCVTTPAHAQQSDHFHPTGGGIPSGVVYAVAALPAITSLTANAVLHGKSTRNFRGNLGTGAGLFTEIVGAAMLTSGEAKVGLVFLGLGAYTHKMGRQAFREGTPPRNTFTIAPTLEKRQNKSNIGIVASYSFSL
jgi:hypothetical protein